MRLHSLGGLELEGSSFHWQKPLVLVAYLAVEGPKERRRVAQVFWPNAADAMNSLTVALAQLRRGVPGILHATRERVEVRVACDALEFREALERGALDAALALYDGPFLQDVRPSGVGVELEEWIYERRERLADRLRASLTAEADRRAAIGDFQGAAALAERAHQLDEATPLPPDAFEHLLDLLVAGASPVAAAAYRDADMARSDRPRSPEAARARLAGRSEPSRPPDRLPRFAGALVGRERELRSLGALVEREDVRQVTLTGPGGIGKTRLAAALGRRYDARATGGAASESRSARPDDAATWEPSVHPDAFPDGVAYVSLAASHEVSGAALALVAGLGLPPGPGPGGMAAEDKLHAYLATKRMLLVLDEAEHLVGGPLASFLEGILTQAPLTKVLVTSRQRLRTRYEQVFRLHGLDFAGARAVDAAGAPSGTVGRTPAAELFSQLATAVAPNLDVAGVDADAVDAICRSLEGLPLAIELAASWADSLPLSDIADGIRSDLDFLGPTMHGVPTRHSSVRVVFDHSVDRLEPPERKALARCCVFDGGFTRAAAEQVAGVTARTLSNLVSRSLLRFDAAQQRYQMHALLRLYGAERLAADASDDARTRERHLAYFRGRVAELAPALAGSERASAMATLALDAENLRSAWQHAMVLRDVASLASMADGYGTFLLRTGSLPAGEAAFGEAAAVAEAGPTPAAHQARRAVGMARLLAWLGVFRRERGGSDASDPLRRGLELAEAASAGRDASLVEAFALLHLAGAALDTDLEAAASHAARSFHLYCALQDQAGTAEAMRVLGDAAYRHGDVRRAARLFRRGLRGFRAIGDDRGATNVLGMLSLLGMVGARFEEAAGFAAECYLLCERTGDPSARADGLTLLGMSHFWLGRFAESRSMFAEAAALASRLGNAKALPQALGYVGLASLRLGRYADASEKALQGRSLALEQGNKAMVGWCRWLHGCAALGLGELADAETLLRQSADELRDVGRTSEADWASAVLGHVQRKLGDRSAARRTLARVLTRSVDARDFPSTILAMPAVALLLADAQSEARALELLGLMERYPVIANCHWFEDIALRELHALADALPTETAQTVHEQGRTLELWATAEALRGDLEAGADRGRS